MCFMADLLIDKLKWHLDLLYTSRA